MTQTNTPSSTEMEEAETRVQKKLDTYLALLERPKIRRVIGRLVDMMREALFPMEPAKVYTPPPPPPVEILKSTGSDEKHRATIFIAHAGHLLFELMTLQIKCQTPLEVVATTRMGVKLVLYGPQALVLLDFIYLKDPNFFIPEECFVLGITGYMGDRLRVIRPSVSDGAPTAEAAPPPKDKIQ